MKRGGQGGIFETVPLLRAWADAFYNDHMSPKMVYTFRTETIGLENLEEKDAKKKLPAKAIELELLRIAKRQWNKKKGKEFNEQALKDLVGGIMNLHVAGGLSLDEISKFLLLAAFLGKGENR